MNNKGHTLLELMIVVCMMGILAGIAMPSYMNYALQAKRAEVPTLVTGIKTAELAYHSCCDAYITASLSPAGAIGPQLQDFDYTQAGWSQLGWKPDGQVRGQYQVVVTGGGGSAMDFQVMGEIDVDGDSTNATYTATSSVNATLDPMDRDVY